MTWKSSKFRDRSEYKKKNSILEWLKYEKNDGEDENVIQPFQFEILEVET